MKLCRFDGVRLGAVDGDALIDISELLRLLPAARWPVPAGDALVRRLEQIACAAAPLIGSGKRIPLATVKLESPIANPGKVIGAPVNYLRHQTEANADGGVNFEKDVKTISHYGLFLKAVSSVVGPGAGVEIAFEDRRTDHEIELVAIIGKDGRKIPRERALEHVAGYAIGLDMTIRGPEDRSLRKSLDSFTVLGPWLVTRDEIGNPNELGMQLSVNGSIRQSASTADMIFDVERLIEYASSFYTLHAGDLIFTGTPEGVGPVGAGDVMQCVIEGIGRMDVVVRTRSVD